MAYGLLSALEFQFQNSLGTILTNSLNAIPVTGESIEETIEQIAEESIYGRFSESPRHAGRYGVGGNVEMEFHPLAVGHFLRAAFGQVTTTSGTGIQTHVFEPRLTTDWDAYAALPPFGLRISRNVNSGWLYGDLLADNLTISIVNGQPLKLSAGVIGGLRQRTANATPTYVAQQPTLWDSSSISFNGVGNTELRQATITLKNNLDRIYTLVDTFVPQRYRRTNFVMPEVSGTLLFEQDSLYQWFSAQSEFATVFNFVGQQSPNTVTFDFPRLRLTKFAPQIRAKGSLEVDFTGVPMYLSTSNTAFRCTLVNTQTVY